ncbi:LysE family translocator [Frigidibacter sp.]|uniref:LysE family translocator n=1 Tax=Frigidibacter sp. TaxID=2586418 RepID=UPI002735C9B0|nr:LysE family translocator [Frigidibacter sp.]MDP3339462.1 LysE family translocator [Frigidibacter sp.]
MIWDVLQAFPAESLLAFTLGGLVLNLAPGPDVLFATASGLQGGPRAGVMAGLGVGFGGLWHVTLAVLGLSALIAAHPGALDAIRWVGAGYLLWLAWKSWRAGPIMEARGTASPWRAVAKGFLTNALNPKPILFVLAFLPQFTDPAYGPVWQQVAILGAIFTVTGTLVTMGYGALAGVAGRSLSRRMGAMNKIAALLFGGLALRLVAD